MGSNVSCGKESSISFVGLCKLQQRACSGDPHVRGNTSEECAAPKCMHELFHSYHLQTKLLLNKHK